MDFYIVLGLERARRVGDIKRAYRRLARRYHPDINPGDRLAAAQFRQIAEAYETLERSGAPAPLRRDRHRRRRRRSRRRSGSRGSTSPSASAEPRRRPSAICSPTCSTSARRGATKARPSGAPICIRRSRSRFEDAMRGGQHAADRHAPGALPRRAGARAGCRSPRRRCAHCQGAGRRQVGARPHGVLEAVRAVRRHRAAAADALSDVRRGSRSRCGPSR